MYLGLAVQIVVSGYTHHVFIATLLVHLLIFGAKDVFKINLLKWNIIVTLSNTLDDFVTKLFLN